MKKRRIVAARTLELGANGTAPVAFRVWEAGENRTDDGPTVFSKRSAKLLLAEQEKRGNLYSIDYDHLSLLTNRPARAGQAAGWHRLDVREGPKGPELWAVDVEWCDEAKAGLEAKPPKWRYFSPAYDIDPDTRDVISYLNTALTNNPKTWSNNALATRAIRTKARTMKKSALLAMLKAMAEEGEGEVKKAAAALFATMGGEEALKAAQADEEEEEGDEETEGEGEGGEEEQHEEEEEAEEEEPQKTPAGTSTLTPKAASSPAKPSKGATKGNVELAVRVAKIEAQLASNAVQALVTKHADRFTPATRAWALTQPIDVVESYVKAAPKLDMRAPKTTTSAPRGDNQGKGAVADPKVEEEIDKAMGLSTERKGKPGFGSVNAEGRRVLNALRPSQLRATRGQKEE